MVVSTKHQSTELLGVLVFFDEFHTTDGMGVVIGTLVGEEAAELPLE